MENKTLNSKFKLKGKPINNLSGYYTDTIGDLIFYFKDGKLHRELGPAIFWKSEKDIYFSLGDEDLYVRRKLKKFQNFGDAALILFEMSIKWKLYYLNNVQYTEEEFNSLLEKKKLTEELQGDLPIIANNDNKKIKI